jgi:hypothetical protein
MNIDGKDINMEKTKKFFFFLKEVRFKQKSIISFADCFVGMDAKAMV